MWTLNLQAAGGQPAQTFAAGKVRIGKDADCDVRLSGWRIGAKHAELFVSNEQGFLRDLGTSVGTSVNGKAVKVHGPLSAEDEIQIGPHTFTASWVPPRAVADVPAVAVPVAQPATPVAPSQDLLAAPAVQDESFAWRRV